MIDDATSVPPQYQISATSPNINLIKNNKTKTLFIFLLFSPFYLCYPSPISIPDFHLYPYTPAPFLDSLQQGKRPLNTHGLLGIESGFTPTPILDRLPSTPDLDLVAESPIAREEANPTRIFALSRRSRTDLRRSIKDLGGSYIPPLRRNWRRPTPVVTRSISSRNKRRSRISELGDDLLVEILILSFPNPKSASRCQAVCKQWNSLISSPASIVVSSPTTRRSSHGY
ncbi:hypothetical protein LINGRAHAP2_LOCUS18015 [Linum grandiflorum]